MKNKRVEKGYSLEYLSTFIKVKERKLYKIEECFIKPSKKIKAKIIEALEITNEEYNGNED